MGLKKHLELPRAGHVIILLRVSAPGLARVAKMKSVRIAAIIVQKKYPQRSRYCAQKYM